MDITRIQLLGNNISNVVMSRLKFCYLALLVQSWVGYLMSLSLCCVFYKTGANRTHAIKCL